MKKSILFFAFLCCLNAISHAQLLFEDHNIMESTSQPVDVKLTKAFDLDNDGDMDVITAFDEVIVWYENTDGFGNFSNPKIITTYADSPTAIDIADLDNDGDLDLLSASEGDDKIAWYENADGLGTFGAQQIISTFTDLPQSVHAADIDGDGDLDVLSASKGDGKIAWYENENGLGTFGDEQIIDIDLNDVKNAEAKDFDGDGDLDIIATNSYVVNWYENEDGLGGFGDQQSLTIFWDADLISTADVDGDSDLDVIYTTGLTSGKEIWYYIFWRENLDGLGNFGNNQTIRASDSAGFESLYVADIDGDGDVDVLSDMYGDGEINWYRNIDGFGNFSTLQFANTENRVHSFFAADLDSDGDIDVLTNSLIDDKIRWYKNDNQLSEFGDEQIIYDPNPVDGPTSTFAADLDGDGDMDALVAAFNNDLVVWFENEDGQGTFGEQQIITTNADGVSSVYSIDLDGDGDMDVLSASYKDDKIAWYENDGLENFSDQQIITTEANGAISVFSADLDGDGDLDVLSASFNDDKIAWYENENGQGDFSDPQIITENIDWASSVFATDIDGDGDLDVLSTSQLDDKLAWYENVDGLGNFGDQQIVSTDGDRPYSVFAADLDSDGDMDLLCASSIDKKIAWYENEDGLGAFGTQQIITTNADGARSVYATDMDGDGDLDVLSASEGDHKIAWYNNEDGLGTFGNQQLITQHVAGARSVHAADFDGDGQMDVLAAAYSENEIAWYKNIGLDTEAPVAVCQNKSIPINLIGVASISLIDIDNGSTDNGINHTFEITQSEFSCLDVGENNIVLTVSDAAGNSDSCTSIVTVTDNSPPFVYAQDQTLINLGGMPSITITPDQIDNGSFDNCSIAELSLDQNTFTEVGEYTINLIAEDFNSNTSTTAALVTVIDDSAPPTAICQDVVAELSPTGVAWIGASSINNASTDDSGIVDYEISEHLYYCDDLGANEVTLTITDVLNNTSTCTAIVNVVDNVFPTINTQNITIDLAGESSISITPDQIDNGSVDNCGIISMSLDQGTFTEVGAYPVLFTATDAGYNSKSETAIVTVINSVVGVEDLTNFNKNLIIHPIPTTNQLTIKAPSNITQINIYNTQGQLLISQNTNSVSISNINLTNLARGLYFCEVKDNAGNIGVRKVIKK